MANYQSTYTGAQIDAGVDKANKALVKPDSAPTSTSLVAIDNSNTQTMLTIGDGLSVENGALKATGGSGGGTQLYMHSIFGNTISDGYEFYFGFISTKSSVYTFDMLKNLLPPDGNPFYVSGIINIADNTYPIVNIRLETGTTAGIINIILEYLQNNNLTQAAFDDITDTVTPL